MTKDRIVFFTSGDFATETFKSLIENGYNVVGLVTTASDDINSPASIASEYGIPTYPLPARTAFSRASAATISTLTLMPVLGVKESSTRAFRMVP